MANLGFPHEQALWNRHNLVEIRLAGVNYSQLSLPVRFGRGAGIPIEHVDSAFSRNNVGAFLAQQQQDQPEVNQPNTHLGPCQF